MKNETGKKATEGRGTSALTRLLAPRSSMDDFVEWIDATNKEIARLANTDVDKSDLSSEEKTMQLEREIRIERLLYGRKYGYSRKDL